MSDPIHIDRRTTIKWVLAAAASMPVIPRSMLASAQPTTPTVTIDTPGYGTDPDLMRLYRPGALWRLTFTASDRRTATTLCDVILPADADSPAASAVGVVDFIDEWISAPYPEQAGDRRIVLEGLTWLDAESMRRFGRGFADSDAMSQSRICDSICYLPKAEPGFEPAARFFARFRDLVVGGFYTTPEGIRDLRYVGNVALARFEGPPPEVLRKVGIGEECA